MSEKRVVVPSEMGVAVARAVHGACGRVDYHPQIRVALEEALLWLSENPIVPTPEQCDEIRSAVDAVMENGPGRQVGESLVSDGTCETCVEWQRRMFLAPEPPDPEVPEAGLTQNPKENHGRS